MATPGDEYRLLIEGAQDYAIFILDTRGRVSTWNRGAERIKGYRAEEIIGQHFSRFYQRHEVLAGKPLEELRIAAETGRFEEEGWRVRKDGTLFWASVLIIALRDPSGELRGFGKVTRDLTEKKKAEEMARELIREQAARTAAELGEAKLRESEDRYRQLSRRLEIILEGVGDSITVQDQSSRVIFANTAAARSIGLASVEELPAAAPRDLLEQFDLFDEEGRPFDPERLPGRLVLRGIEAEPVLLRVRHRATASEWWSLVRAGAVGDESGRPQFAVSIWHDVTTLRREELSARSLAQASEALSQSLDYEAALGRLATTLVPHLADWCEIDIVEEGATKLVAMANVDPKTAEMGRTVRLRYPELAASTSVGEVIRGGSSKLYSELTREELQRQLPNPETQRAVLAFDLRSLIVVPLKTQKGTLGAMTLATVRAGRRYDEHDLALAEELGRRAGIAIENSRLYRDAQRAIKLRDEFLSIAGHELKTPLTALDLQLQILLGAVTKGAALREPERSEERLRKTISQSRRLGRLVHELLDVSRITSGRLALELETIDMARLGEEIIERHASEIARAGSEISLAARGETTGTWDASRIDQVISNLLNNAIKYGAGRPIDVRLEGQKETVVLSVRDRGIGIAAEHQARIFQRFERAASERNYGGLGLGLWIAREIVQAHGGSVRFESAPGCGSTFIVELPRAQHWRG